MLIVFKELELVISLGQANLLVIQTIPLTQFPRGTVVPNAACYLFVFCCLIRMKTLNTVCYLHTSVQNVINSNGANHVGVATYVPEDRIPLFTCFHWFLGPSVLWDGERLSVHTLSSCLKYVDHLHPNFTGASPRYLLGPQCSRLAIQDGWSIIKLSKRFPLNENNILCSHVKILSGAGNKPERKTIPEKSPFRGQKQWFLARRRHSVGRMPCCPQWFGWQCSVIQAVISFQKHLHPCQIKMSMLAHTLLILVAGECSANCTCHIGVHQLS